MLVLSRKVGQELIIGDNIRIVINRVAGNRVAVAIEAPENIPIVRGELQVLQKQFHCSEFPANEYGEEARSVLPLTAAVHLGDSSDAGSYTPRCAR
jgi:carbon storage regulator CsrA